MLCKCGVGVAVVWCRWVCGVSVGAVWYVCMCVSVGVVVVHVGVVWV